eukprot:GHVL01011871.1.p1 GENE.GHVL01011871.1~~GHVL01011871.1.p1  ORF type:complete len:526 (-),score=50.08 GHVL01011871.1:2735-4312(-)
MTRLRVPPESEVSEDNLSCHSVLLLKIPVEHEPFYTYYQAWSAVSSLYADCIKPTHKNVCGRLREMLLPRATAYTIYRGLSSIFDAGELVVLLKDPPVGWNGFVAPEDPHDPYHEGRWAQFEQFMQRFVINSGATGIPGGRYRMAKLLQAANLDFVDGMSLGEICHMLQLAISKRKILLYEKKHIKPAQSSLKHQSANLAVPLRPKRHTCKMLTSLTDVRIALSSLLRRHPEGVLLSNLLQLLEEDLGMELQYTVFRHVKLSEFLSIEEFSDILQVQFNRDCDKAHYVIPTQACLKNKEESHSTFACGGDIITDSTSASLTSVSTNISRSNTSCVANGTKKKTRRGRAGGRKKQASREQKLQNSLHQAAVVAGNRLSTTPQYPRTLYSSDQNVNTALLSRPCYNNPSSYYQDFIFDDNYHQTADRNYPLEVENSHAAGGDSPYLIYGQNGGSFLRRSDHVWANDKNYCASDKNYSAPQESFRPENKLSQWSPHSSPTIVPDCNNTRSEVLQLPAWLLDAVEGAVL